MFSWTEIQAIILVVIKKENIWLEWKKLNIGKFQDVQKIKLPIHPFFPDMFVNIYIVDELLIDTGPKQKKARLAEILHTNNIQKVAITHEHNDHCGMAKWIAKNFSVPIYMNKEKMKKIPFACEQYPEKIECRNHTFIPIFTPGHTRAHTCLYEPNKGWLFSGDLYVTPQPKVSLWSESLSKYIMSLKTVLTLDFDTLFCAHQGIVENGRKKLEEKLEYLEQIQKEAVELYNRGYSVRVIAKKLFPKKARLERISFGAFSSLHLVRQLIRAHNKQV